MKTEVKIANPKTIEPIIKNHKTIKTGHKGFISVFSRLSLETMVHLSLGFYLQSE